MNERVSQIFCLQNWKIYLIWAATKIKELFNFISSPMRIFWGVKTNDTIVGYSSIIYHVYVIFQKYFLYSASCIFLILLVLSYICFFQGPERRYLSRFRSSNSPFRFLWKTTFELSLYLFGEVFQKLCITKFWYCGFDCNAHNTILYYLSISQKTTRMFKLVSQSISIRKYFRFFSFFRFFSPQWKSSFQIFNLCHVFDFTSNCNCLLSNPFSL